MALNRGSGRIPELDVRNRTGENSYVFSFYPTTINFLPILTQAPVINGILARAEPVFYQFFIRVGYSSITTTSSRIKGFPTSGVLKVISRGQTVFQWNFGVDEGQWINNDSNDYAFGWTRPWAGPYTSNVSNLDGVTTEKRNPPLNSGLPNTVDFKTNDVYISRGNNGSSTTQCQYVFCSPAVFLNVGNELTMELTVNATTIGTYTLFDGSNNREETLIPDRSGTTYDSSVSAQVSSSALPGISISNSAQWVRGQMSYFNFNATTIAPETIVEKGFFFKKANGIWERLIFNANQGRRVKLELLGAQQIYGYAINSLNTISWNIVNATTAPDDAGGRADDFRRVLSSRYPTTALARAKSGEHARFARTAGNGWILWVSNRTTIPGTGQTAGLTETQMKVWDDANQNVIWATFELARNGDGLSAAFLVTANEPFAGEMRFKRCGDAFDAASWPTDAQSVLIDSSALRKRGTFDFAAWKIIEDRAGVLYLANGATTGYVSRDGGQNWVVESV